MEDFTNLINESNKEQDKHLFDWLKVLDEPEGLKKLLDRNNKKYIKNPEKKITKLLTARYAKYKKEAEEKINAVANAPDFKDNFVITIEWKPSKTWGSNPHAYGSNGFEGSSISGCGYDKRSTATAQALNSNKSILKLLYKKKNDNIAVSNHELLGYGSGYGILPSFEEGVGVESHKAIIEGIGLKMQTITNTKNTDVFLISRM